MAIVTPTKKRLIRNEVAMLLAEKGLDSITCVTDLLEHDMTYMKSRTTFKKVFKGTNWGTFLASLRVTHPELMELAENKKTPTPKAKAKPATKVASKKEK